MPPQARSIQRVADAVSTRIAQAPQYLIIALIFAGLDTLVMLGYAFVGARAIRVLTASATRWIDRACGGMLLALAGSLAFYRRSAA